MRGPLSWYRTAEANFEDELALLGRGDGSGVNFTMPGLYVGATMDTALPPSDYSDIRHPVLKAKMEV
ncbi:Epoxide hydrolase srdG like protein [Verticillium longisporum]|nr:Epoxide hydrolase srdG like protein [Verticillium longisporum]